jgi:GAF domain-containing protein
VDDLSAWSALLEQTASVRRGQPQRICEMCVPALSISGGGISMVTTTGNRGIICATDEVAAYIEDLQFILGEGPCVEATQTDAPVLIDDLSERLDRRDAQWSAFSQSASSRGVGAVFAFPLRIGSVSVGVLDLYRRSPGALSRDELAGALLAADAAADALLYLQLQAGGDLSFARDLRDIHDMQVHQATGMVMAQLGVTIEDALAMLRARAFATGRPLAQVSRDVVDRRLRFTKEDS